MKKVILNDNLALYSTKNFPCDFTIQKNTNKKYKYFLGIGGNVGDTFKIFEQFLKLLHHDDRFDIQKTSPILKNPPFGYLNQSYFYNSMIVLYTDLPAFYALKIFQKYEKKLHRIKTFQDAPRTLDIDIIFITKNGKNIEINTQDLTIPHKSWSKRQSVVIPFSFVK